MKKIVYIILTLFSLTAFAVAKDAAILEKMNNLYPLTIKDMGSGNKYTIMRGGKAGLKGLSTKNEVSATWTVKDDHLHIYVNGEEKTAYNLFIIDSLLLINDEKPLNSSKNEWSLVPQE